MKVRCVVTVDVDPEAWADNYGVTGDELREDVRDYVAQLVRAQLDAVGVLVPSS